MIGTFSGKVSKTILFVAINILEIEKKYDTFNFNNFLIKILICTIITVKLVIIFLERGKTNRNENSENINTNIITTTGISTKSNNSFNNNNELMRLFFKSKLVFFQYYQNFYYLI